jgi:hypothetical protein
MTIVAESTQTGATVWLGSPARWSFARAVGFIPAIWPPGTTNMLHIETDSIHTNRGYAA